MGRSALIGVLFCAACQLSDELPAVPLLPRFDGGIVCQGNAGICPLGTRCTNSVCVETCIDGAACPAGKFCEGSAPADVCAPIGPATCAIDIECPFPQFCDFGLCGSLVLVADGGLQPCTLNASPDGCAADALCTVTASGAGACVGQSACAQDGRCPGSSDSASYICNQFDGGGVLFEVKLGINHFRGLPLRDRGRPVRERRRLLPLDRMSGRHLQLHRPRRGFVRRGLPLNKLRMEAHAANDGER